MDWNGQILPKTACIIAVQRFDLDLDSDDKARKLDADRSEALQ
jgi:hypothetical protein